MPNITGTTAYPRTHEPDKQPENKRHFYIICNECSGSSNASNMRQALEEHLIGPNHTYELIQTAVDKNFLQNCRRVAERAQENDGVLVAAGGDGTVNLVASLCCRYQLTLGVIPLGTFNYFARDLGIPTHLGQALQIIRQGFTRGISVGYVNQHLFLNNASLGLYTRIIRNRERDKAHFGRYRLVAFLSALATLFQKQRPLAVKLQLGAEEIVRKTAMIFVGNNTLQLKNFNLQLSECTQHDRLAVILMKKITYRDTVRLILRGLFKQLDDEQQLEMLCADRFEVETKAKVMDVVVDGELIRCATPLSFTVAHRGLQVLVPPPEIPLQETV